MGRKELDMKHLLRRTAAAVLGISFMLPAAACSKTKTEERSHSGKLIEEDMPWFETTVFEIDNGVDPGRKTQYMYSELAGSDEENMIIFSQGNYEPPKDYDWEYSSYLELLISNVVVADKKTGKTKKIIDLVNYLGEGMYPDSVIYHDGNIVVAASSYDPLTYGRDIKEYVIDPVTGDILSVTERDPDVQASQIFYIGDYQIRVSINWDAYPPEGYLFVTGPDGNEKKIKIEDGNSYIYSVDSVVPKGKDKAVIILGVDLGFDYFELNLKTGDMTKLDSTEFEWLDSLTVINMINGSDGNIYSCTPTGISKIDIENKTKEEVFNYSWCSVDRSILMNYRLGEISEDSFILYGERYEMSPFSDLNTRGVSSFEILSFTKSGKNPHAGKRILELYTPSGSLDLAMCDALAKFNETNDKYFIEVTDRYNSGANSLSNVNSDDELSQSDNEYFDSISNKLSIDIINGEGPDMFLDISHIDKLNNSGYLADLTPYTGDLDPERYFTNIIDNAKVDGKLYNLPICFGISGIHTDGAYSGSSGIGFTTDEYVDFLKGPLNGKDVITQGQPYYFVKLFNAMRNEFIKNGKADFSGPEFEAIADYVKDNVPERSLSWNESSSSLLTYYGPELFEYTSPALYTTSYSFVDYFITLQQLESGSSILGVPTSDGRGPSVLAYSSIAISAHAYDTGACGDFVKLLMSDEIQEEYSLSGRFVLNREYFRSTAEAAVEYYNKNSIIDIFGSGPDAAPKNTVKYTTEHIDILENAILNCSSVLTEDTDINKVLIEEMPSYFSGQKSLEDVVAIAQDRVQKVLDERG